MDSENVNIYNLLKLVEARPEIRRFVFSTYPTSAKARSTNNPPRVELVLPDKVTRNGEKVYDFKNDIGPVEDLWFIVVGIHRPDLKKVYPTVEDLEKAMVDVDED